jgi:hypothetical protein
MLEYIMKKEVCGTFHAKCGMQDLTKVFGTVPRKAGRVVTLPARSPDLNPCDFYLWGKSERQSVFK